MVKSISSPTTKDLAPEVNLLVNSVIRIASKVTGTRTGKATDATAEALLNLALTRFKAGPVTPGE